MPRLIIIVSVCALLAQSGGFEPPSASELLDKYAATQDKLQSSFITTSKSIAEGSSNHPASSGKREYRVFNSDYRYDGKRYSVRLDRWLKLDSLPDKPLGKDHKSYNYSRELWDGKTTFSYYTRDNRDQRNQLGTLSIDKNRKPSTMELLPRGEMFGRFAGDDKRIDEVLRQADVMSLRDQTERVGGAECYIIDAIVKGAKYTVWLDPQHGYNIARVEVRKTQGSMAYGRSLEAGFSIVSSFKVARFEQVDGIWSPMETYSEGESKWPGGYFSKGTTHTETISVMLNPDHDKLGSFVLDDVPNGAEVFIVDAKGNPHTWKNGKVVDKTGKVIMDCKPEQTQDSRIDIGRK